MHFVIALLITGLTLWPLVYLRNAGARRGKRPTRSLLVLMAGNALLPAAYLILSAFDYHRTLVQGVQASTAAVVAGEVDPARQLVELNQQRDRHRGYRAGRALATDDQHRGSKVPNPAALAAIARIRGKGQSGEFQDGFREGYAAGLTGDQPGRRDDLSKR